MIADELVNILGFELRGEHNLRKFTKGMGTAAKRARAFARTIAVAGAAAGAAAATLTGAVLRMADTVARDLDTLGKTADKVGVGVEALQELRFAAVQMAGVAEGTLDMALQRFSRRIGEAANGSGELKGIIDELGIELRNADGSLKTSEVLLGEFADQVANAESEQEALRIAFKMFDSEGAALVNMMRNGAAGIEVMRNQAVGLGLVMSKDAIEASTKFNDAQDRSRRILEAFRRMVAVELLPTFTNWMDRFQGFWRESIANGNVDRWATQVSDGVLAVFDAIRGFGESGAAILDFIKGLTGAKSRVQAFLFALAGISAVVAPWTTAVVAILLLVEDLVGFLQGRESLIGDIIEKMKGWFDGLWQSMTPQVEFILQEWAALSGAMETALKPVERFIEGFRARLAGFDLGELFGRGGEAFTGLGAAFRDLGDGIAALGAAINDLFAQRAGKADFASMVGQSLGQLAASSFIAQVELVVGAVETIAAGLRGVADALQLFAQGEFMAGFERIGQAIVEVADQVIETLARMIDAFLPDLGALEAWEDLKARFDELLAWFQGWVDRINAVFAGIQWPQPPKWWTDRVNANQSEKAGASIGGAVGGYSSLRVKSAHGTSSPALPADVVQRIGELTSVIQRFANDNAPTNAAEIIAQDNSQDNRDQSVSAPVTVNQTLTTVQQLAPSAARAAGRNTGNAVAQQSRVAAEPAR